MLVAPDSTIWFNFYSLSKLSPNSSTVRYVEGIGKCIRKTVRLLSLSYNSSIILTSQFRLLQVLVRVLLFFVVREAVVLAVVGVPQIPRAVRSLGAVH